MRKPPDFTPETVVGRHIKQLIQSGQYQVRTAAIVDAMLERAALYDLIDKEIAFD